MPRKVNKESEYNVENRRLANEHGGLENDKKVWSSKDLDELLDAFFDQECVYVSTRACFSTICKRSVASITDQLWKMFTRYDRASVTNYKSGKRVDRTNQKPTLRDFACIEQAMSVAGTARAAYRPQYLGTIMGRLPSDVFEIYRNILQKARDKQLIPDLAPATSFKGTTDQLIVIREAVNGSYHKVLTEIGQ